MRHRRLGRIRVPATLTAIAVIMAFSALGSARAQSQARRTVLKPAADSPHAFTELASRPTGDGGETYSIVQGNASGTRAIYYGIIDPRDDTYRAVRLTGNTSQNARRIFDLIIDAGDDPRAHSVALLKMAKDKAAWLRAPAEPLRVPVPICNDCEYESCAGQHTGMIQVLDPPGIVLNQTTNSTDWDFEDDGNRCPWNVSVLQPGGHPVWPCWANPQTAFFTHWFVLDCDAINILAGHDYNVGTRVDGAYWNSDFADPKLITTVFSSYGVSLFEGDPTIYTLVDWTAYGEFAGILRHFALVIETQNSCFQ